VTRLRNVSSPTPHLYILLVICSSQSNNFRQRTIVCETIRCLKRQIRLSKVKCTKLISWLRFVHFFFLLPPFRDPPGVLEGNFLAGGPLGVSSFAGASFTDGLIKLFSIMVCSRLSNSAACSGCVSHGETGIRVYLSP